MSVLKASAVGGGVLGIILLIVFLVAAPILLVGGLISVVFGIGFWLASGYVAIARFALLMLGIG